MRRWYKILAVLLVVIAGFAYCILAPAKITVYERSFSVSNISFMVEQTYRSVGLNTDLVNTVISYTITSPGRYIFHGRQSRYRDADEDLGSWDHDLTAEQIPFSTRRSVWFNASQAYRLEITRVPLDGGPATDTALSFRGAQYGDSGFARVSSAWQK